MLPVPLHDSKHPGLVAALYGYSNAHVTYRWNAKQIH